MIDKLLIPEIYLPIIYVIIAFLLNSIIKKLIDKIISRRQQELTKSSYNYKKTETFKVLLKNIAQYIIVIFLILSVLTVYGINVTSILAGLGIVGLVVGLALQDLAKDLIAGITIILENQYAIGDTISINNFKGEVIMLGLKSTRIKNYEGQIKIIANRNISEVINYSMANSLAIVDIDIHYDEETDKVEKVLKDLIEEFNSTLPNLKGKVDLLGIQELASSSVKYRIIAPTVSMEHYSVERKMRKMIKDRLDQEKIKIAYPQIEVHNGK